jgi:hypothetical protein
VDGPRRRSTIVIAAGAAWVTAVAAGFCLVNGHAATPGRSGIRTRDWPVESPVVADPTRANLVMLIHPRCPCSRASLAGLEKILTVCRSYLVAHVFFLEPKVPTTAWGIRNSGDGPPPYP